MSKETFSDEVKQAVYTAQNGMCLGCLEPIHSYHHKLSNTEPNRKLYPHFIHSPMNCAGLCMNCHTNKDHLYKVTYQEAGIYERWLEEKKCLI